MKPVVDPEAANIDPVTGIKHPFPIDGSFQVMKVGDKSGTTAETPVKVFHAPTPAPVISGQVSEWDGPVTLDHMINHLVDAVYDNSPEGKRLEKEVKHLSGKSSKSLAVTKDAFEHCFQYQGFDPSARAGKLILDDKYKIRNIAWAEYERQQFVDKIHAEIVANMMQLAEGIGMPDPAQGAPVISSAKSALQSLIGAEETQRTIDGLTHLLNNTKVAETAFTQKPWNTIERNKKLEGIVTTALSHDSVVKEVDKRLQKYANPNQKVNAAVKVASTGLNGIAYFAPGLAIPLGAEIIEAGIKESTGGSEENKLERELLLDKRIQSRFKVLSHEASLAVDNYRYALVTRNSPLLVFSDELISNMTGQKGPLQLASSNIKTSPTP
jgi:hypothetical protein